VLVRGKTVLGDSERQELSTVLSAALTLLALLIGFSFSMAAGRYDQRKNDEENEANAIGTAYVRAGVLSPPEAARARELLRRYTGLRIVYYETRDSSRLAVNAGETTQVQNDLWQIAQAEARRHPTAVSALFASGINDVLNSQGYTQAAWWNRIPSEAWLLMVAMAVACSAIFGYLAQPGNGRAKRVFLIPAIVSIALFLIADLDSPRGGLIHVTAQNLESLQPSLH
ncbi:MAG TPA: hypothetical protein VMF61_14080, partial [Candidatus Acidoferrales bacterium]|nr:hypothetical protein [Candidatus Acidoferrales bacterium]